MSKESFAIMYSYKINDAAPKNIGFIVCSGDACDMDSNKNKNAWRTPTFLLGKIHL